LRAGGFRRSNLLFHNLNYLSSADCFVAKTAHPLNCKGRSQ
jgi:hypothetical protein